MSEKPIRVADDFDFIAKRVKEMRAERERDENVETASDRALEILARRVGLERKPSESDFYLRNRIKDAMKENAA